jgi:hypothetical protein
MKINVRSIADEKTCAASWGGRGKKAKDGAHFRCYLCGHRFKPGDGYRMVIVNGKKSSEGLALRNFITCDTCDGPTVLDRWARAIEEARTRFWWLWADAYESDV